MSSAICFSLDQSKILSSGHGLNPILLIISHGRPINSGGKDGKRLNKGKEKDWEGKSASFNPLPNKPWFLRVCTSSLLETLWEKEKLLVTSNFSFSHIVFYRCRELSDIFIKFKIVVCKPFQFGRVQNLSFGKGIT